MLTSRRTVARAASRSVRAASAVARAVVASSSEEVTAAAAYDGALAHRLGDRRLPAAPLPARGGPLAGSELGAGGGLQGVGAPGHRPGALLPRAQGEAQLGLGGPGGRRGLREPVALVGGRLLLAGLGAGVVEALLQGGQLLAVADQGAFGGVDGLLGALGLAAGGPDRGAELAEPLGHRRHPGVGLVQPFERALDGVGA